MKTKMSETEVLMALSGVNCLTDFNRGDTIHICYNSFGKKSSKAKQEATIADELGLPEGHYTGKLIRTWWSDHGDLMVTMRVELERPNVIRTFNASKGEFLKVIILGR